MYDLPGEVSVILITIWWLQIYAKISISKQAAQKFDVERFSLRKRNELEIR